MATSHPVVAAGTPEIAAAAASAAVTSAAAAAAAAGFGVLRLMERAVSAGRKAGGSGGECTARVCARHHSSNRPQAKGAYLNVCAHVILVLKGFGSLEKGK